MLRILSHPGRERPAVGWAAALLALAAALTPAVAAAQSPLQPPAGPIFWAAIVGLLAGFDGAASEPRGRAARLAKAATHTLFWTAGALLLVAAAGAALPPWVLLQQDLGGIVARALGQGGGTLPPRTGAFMAGAVARLAGDLSASLVSGERGARLLVGTVGALLTWAAAPLLGRAAATGRALLGLSAPTLLALAFLAIPGGGGGGALAAGMALVAIFVAVAGFAGREREWDSRGTDYSEELRRDIALWAFLVSAVALAAGWALPLWPGNPIARMLDSIGDVPSGVTALREGMQPSGGGSAEVGLSTLPSLPLGESLAQGPPGQPALRVTLETPLPDGPAIHYWRMRVFDTYSGLDWSATARVETQPPAATNAAFVGAVVQEVEDLRPDRQLLVGLPDIIAASVRARAERFEDGSLAALAGDPIVSRYTLLSRPQELADRPEADRAVPDMTAYLQIPSDMPPRVRELALAVVGGSPDPYERAVLIERYLRDMPYSYQVAPLPGDGDAVDQFLFEMRSGYCTYYASAMAVMARSLGIPSRVAIGYATGERTDGGYLVRESDAHAWPELYIDGRWTPFEPTPIRPLPSRSEGHQMAPAAPLPEPRQAPPIWELLAAVAAAAALGAGGWLLLRRRGEAPPPDALGAALRALEASGARLALAWPEGATVREFAAMVAPRAGAGAGPIGEIVEYVERARYGGRRLSALERARLDLAVERLRQAVAEQQPPP